MGVSVGARTAAGSSEAATFESHTTTSPSSHTPCSRPPTRPVLCTSSEGLSATFQASGLYFQPNFLVLLAAPQERNLLWPLWFCQGCSSRCAEPQGRSGLTHDTSLRAHSSALLVGSHPGSISSLLSKVLFKVASASCPELHPVEGEQEEHLSPTQSLYPARAQLTHDSSYVQALTMAGLGGQHLLDSQWQGPLDTSRGLEQLP